MVLDAMCDSEHSIRIDRHVARFVDVWHAAHRAGADVVAVQPAALTMSLAIEKIAGKPATAHTLRPSNEQSLTRRLRTTSSVLQSSPDGLTRARQDRIQT